MRQGPRATLTEIRTQSAAQDFRSRYVKDFHQHLIKCEVESVVQFGLSIIVGRPVRDAMPIMSGARWRLSFLFTACTARIEIDTTLWFRW